MTTRTDAGVEKGRSKRALKKSPRGTSAGLPQDPGRIVSKQIFEIELTRLKHTLHHDDGQINVVRGADRLHTYLKKIAGIRARSHNDLVKQIRAGFRVSVFHTVAKSLDIPDRELGVYTGVPPRTLARRKASGHLMPDESDRLARVALLMEETVELFDGDRGKAAQWLKTTKRALGGATPLEYADTEPGVQEVRTLIGRLQHGVVV